MALIYYSELLPSAFFLAFDPVRPVMVDLHAGSFCSLLVVPVPPNAVSVDNVVFSN